MTETIERFINLRNKLLHMMLQTMPLGPYLLGIALLLIGIAVIEPLLTMSGSVIIAGMIIISFYITE